MWRFSNGRPADLTAQSIQPRPSSAVVVCAVVLCLASVVESSGLVWEQTHREVNVDGPSEVVIDYAFRNDSPKPVTILGTKTSCGCTVGKPSRQTYAPGEIGVLPVSHKPKPGVRAYRIEVMTDEEAGDAQILTLRVNNEPRISLHPRVIRWAAGEPRQPKHVDVRLKTDDPLKVVGAQAESDVVEVKLAKSEEPGMVRLVVAPKEAGAVPGRVRVQILTEPALPPSMDSQFFVVLK